MPPDSYSPRAISNHTQPCPSPCPYPFCTQLRSCVAFYTARAVTASVSGPEFSSAAESQSEMESEAEEEEEVSSTSSSNVVRGKHAVFTGTFRCGKRSAVEALAAAAGVIVGDAVSKNTGNARLSDAMQVDWFGLPRRTAGNAPKLLPCCLSSMPNNLPLLTCGPGSHVFLQTTWWSGRLSTRGGTNRSVITRAHSSKFHRLRATVWTAPSTPGIFALYIEHAPNHAHKHSCPYKIYVHMHMQMHSSSGAKACTGRHYRPHNTRRLPPLLLCGSRLSSYPAIHASPPTTHASPPIVPLTAALLPYHLHLHPLTVSLTPTLSSYHIQCMQDRADELGTQVLSEDDWDRMMVASADADGSGPALSPHAKRKPGSDLRCSRDYLKRLWSCD